MRVDVIAGPTTNLGIYAGGGTNNIPRTTGGVDYMVYIDRALDVVFIKSANGGLTWSNPVTIFTGSAQAVSVWYDRWSGISGDLIHCAYADAGASDILYRNIDAASSDALSTQTSVLAGTSVASGGALSIVRGRDGRLVVAGSIDAGAEDGAWSSTDVGATWSDTIADPSEGATQDQYLLLPGWNADTADVMLIFWDASANELSVKRYDDSGDAWTETSIATSMTDMTAGNAFPNMNAFVDLANSRNVVVAWSQADAANADLRCWIIDDTTITEVTNVVLNSTDDQGLCAIGLDTDTSAWYVFYCGKSDGSETFATALNVYYKASIDAGTTWGAETLLSGAARGTLWLTCTPRFSKDFTVAFYNDATDDNIYVSAPLPVSPRARMAIGVS